MNTAQPEVAQCQNCGRTLTQHTSVREGVGPVCRGWSWDPKVFPRRLRVIEQGSEWIQFSLKSWTNDKDSYDVSTNTETGEARCSCPQFQISHRVCKHLQRAMAYVQRKVVQEMAFQKAVRRLAKARILVEGPSGCRARAEPLRGRGKEMITFNKISTAMDAAERWAHDNCIDLLGYTVKIIDTEKAIAFTQAGFCDFLESRVVLKTGDYQKLAATKPGLPGIEIVPPSEAVYINSERVEIPDEAQKEAQP